MKPHYALFLLVAVALTAQPVSAQRSKKRAPRKPAAAAPAAAWPVITTPSGLTVVMTHRANGRRPAPGDTVLVHYTGMLTNSKKFDSSYDRGEPIAFTLGVGQVIKGWDEGIALLGVGDEAVLVIPPALGYGAKGAGGVIPPDATLVFMVSLVDIRGRALSGILMQTITERGIDAAIAQYRQMKTDGFKDVFASEDDLNGLGYRLLNQKRFKEAVEILKLNVEANPQSFNSYDSLGEAYMLAGDKALAIENYQRSLELNPGNENAAAMLKKLKGEEPAP
jgi:peptidylprolyl isomerase